MWTFLALNIDLDKDGKVNAAELDHLQNAYDTVDSSDLAKRAEEDPIPIRELHQRLVPVFGAASRPPMPSASQGRSRISQRISSAA